MQVKAIFYLLLVMTCPLFLSQCRSKTVKDDELRAAIDTPAIDTVVAPPADTIAIYREALLTAPVDSIWVCKHKREMHVFNNRQLLKVYHICLGTSPLGAKHFEGDRKTPEGLYHIYDKNPNSMAHKNLGVSYPNDNDRNYARRQRRSTGGSIKIHGMVNGYENEEEEYKNTDWTWGCIAVLNKDIDELYEHVAIGSPICITP